MSYTKEERAEIAHNIREFMKQPKKENFEESVYYNNGYINGLKILHRREHNMTHYDREWLETIARDVEGRILHP